MSIRTISPLWRLRLAVLLQQLQALGDADRLEALWQLYGALYGLASGHDVPPAHRATLDSLRAYGCGVYEARPGDVDENTIYAEGERLLQALGDVGAEEVQAARGNSGGAPAS